MKKLLSLLLCAAMILCSLPCALAYGDENSVYTLKVAVDNIIYDIHAYDCEYEGDTYVSLSDVSKILDGTVGSFSFVYSYSDADGEIYTLTTGKAYKDPGIAEYKVTGTSPYRNRLFKDGRECRYYTLKAGKDLFMNLQDVMLMLDMSMYYNDSGELVLEYESSLSPDLTALKNEGYFDSLNAVLVGDADTGRIYFSVNRFRVYPAASLSKLMTWLLVKEAADRGEINLDGTITVSREAAALSNSVNGTGILDEGKTVSVAELMDGMLVASINECALALAVEVCGSEKAFTERMNSRAKELGLKDTRFNNCHGLPCFNKSLFSSKQQNTMTATNLFKLSSYILKTYPEITETSAKMFITLPSISKSYANSNSLVFNYPDVTGLKTGSTDKAGYCVEVSVPVEANGKTHNIIIIVMGAESPWFRDRTASILLKGALAHYSEKGF